MPEKFSSAAKAFGGHPEQQEKVLHAIEKQFQEQIVENMHYAILRDLLVKERGKSEEEKILIGDINTAVRAIALKYGASILNVSEKQIHIVSQSKWKASSPASFYFYDQTIAMIDFKSMSVFTTVIAHEMFHLQSYGSVYLDKIKNTYTPFRRGLKLKLLKNKAGAFSGFDEAITEELSMRVFEQLDIRNRFLNETHRMKQSLRTSNEEKNKDELIDIREIPDVNNELKQEFWRFAYKRERTVLKLLIRKIYKTNIDKFQNEQEIFDIFARAKFGEKLSELSSLVDNTFGIGTFRKLSQLDRKDEPIEKLEEFIRSLT